MELPDLRERFERVRAQMGSSGGGPSGRGPTDGSDLEHRVSALETRVEKMDGKLDRLLDGTGEVRISLARMEEQIADKASASELAGVKGRVDSLPTTWQMITLVVGTVFAILGGSFLILKFGLPHAP